MLDERKTAILRAIVHEYIATAQPVGSTHIAKASGVNVSSATVRNEMAVLEQEGYLVQPHTSAGRIPTDKGYRLFVDTLAAPGPLDTNTSQRVGEFFDATHGRLEEMLHQTSNLLAQLTHHASLVVGPAHERSVIRSVQVVGLSARVAVVVAVLSNGTVENETIEFARDMSELRVGAASSHLQRVLTGRALEHGDSPSSGDPEVDEICAAAQSALLGAGQREPVFVGGTSVVAQSFDAVDTVRQVLQTLEQQYVMVSLVRDVLSRGLSVAIGTEHGVEPLAACSVVVAPVVVDGEHVGTVGVLGPTRMNYPQALATVEVVSERLGKHLGEGAG
ncbi:MAG: heat-inducible transcriptional repressor HrcA [Actinobacteria bacterium]|nr:heat-inducible transcriptional repressor HrcA [Actinomycetota bacterium]